MSAERSVWQAALGERFALLDPALVDYFSPIPAGHVGRGEGVFRVVGTPRRWLWPVLAILGRAGIVFPVWERDVPFDVVNVPADAAVLGRRVFHFPRGDRTMVDEIRITEHGLVDRLGRGGRVEARFDLDVVEGRLELRSRGAALRLGRLRIPVPRFAAPRVRLVERREADAQHVALTMDLPLIGRVYQYAGSFVYRVEPA